MEGKIRLQMGELDRAQRELLEAYRLVRELHVPADEAEVRLRLAELALARGDARQLADRMETLERLGIERLRPDLAEDFRRLKARVAGGGEHPA